MSAIYHSTLTTTPPHRNTVSPETEQPCLGEEEEMHTTQWQIKNNIKLSENLVVSAVDLKQLMKQRCTLLNQTNLTQLPTLIGKIQPNNPIETQLKPI